MYVSFSSRRDRLPQLQLLLPERAPPRSAQRVAQRSALFFLFSLSVAGLTAQTPQTQPNAAAARAHRFLAGRHNPAATSTAESLAAARSQHLAMLAAPRTTSLTAAWQPIGPNQIASLAYGNVTGRITSIAIDSADPTGNTVYLGTTGGGIWKSTNAAGAAANVTFTPLTDTLSVFNANSGTAAIPSLSIGAIAIQNGILLAGTGDPNDATDSFYGSGLLRSADGGVTWSLIQNAQDGTAGSHSFFGLGVAGFAFSTTSPGLVVAALSQAAEGVIVNAPSTSSSVMGLFYSTDAGITWHMGTIQDGSQIVQKPLSAGANNGGNAVTAVLWNPIRQRFYAAVRYHGYYESTDGITWTRLAHQPGSGLTTTACPVDSENPGSIACPIFRGALAVQPITGDLFALTVDRNNLDQGLWRDACALSGSACTGSTVLFANQLAATPLEVGTGNTAIPQGDYNLALTAVPSGTSPDTVLFAGTVDLYRCTLASSGSSTCALRNTTNAANGCAAPAMVAPAQHAIAALLTSSAPLIYLGNDGGLWRSTDGVNQQSTICSPDDATHFQNLNAALGSLAEVVSFAQHPTDPDTLLTGLGANGAAATSTASQLTAWPQVSSGEGGNVAIDQSSPANWYVSTAAGVSITQCTSGSACNAASFTGVPSIGAAQVSGDASLLDPPFLLDPAVSSDLILGTCRIWRGPAAGGSLWSSSNAISPMLAGPQNAACNATAPFIRALTAGGPASSAIASQNAGATVLYAGISGALDGGATASGHLFATTAAGTASGSTAWTDLWSSPVTNDSSDSGQFNPGGFDISSIVVDAHDATGDTLYATVMGFAANGINAPHAYRSTDAGAHWTNISSNLPNAPANSIVVDPNDANTLYVALDTGVYVTTQIATCAAANCWSVYGTALPNAPIVELIASSTVPTGDGHIGELRAATYGRGLWQIPLLNPTNAQAAITLAPTSLTFIAQQVSTASAAQSITVTSTGAGPVTITSITTSGDFTQTNNCPTTAITVNATCTINVVFQPTATGTRSGTLTIFANVSGGQATTTLTGNAVAPAAVVLAPLSLTFAATLIGATSASQNLTISNTGGVSTTLQTPVITGDFTLTANTCGPVLGPGVGCTVSIAFAPTASGTRNGSFSITDGSGTQTATLTGNGTLAATDTLAPLTLAFGPQLLNTTSAGQQVTLTNSGDAALTLISASTTSDFSVVNNCGNSLNAHSSCALTVTFTPTIVGAETGTLTLTDQTRSQAVSLSGTGIAPPNLSFTPPSLTFSTTGIGLTAPPQTIALTSNGGSDIAISSIAVTGDFAIVPGTDACGAALAVNTSCTMQISFTPSAGGTRSGFLIVSGNMPNGHSSAALTGNAVPQATITLVPNALTFASTPTDAISASQSITVSNTGGLTATLQTPILTGDFTLTASTCAATLAASAACTLQVVFAPAASGQRNGTLTLSGNFAANPATATLTGTAVAPATIVLTPLSLTFAATNVGSTTAAQNIAISNTGGATATLQTPTLTGADFHLTANTCGATLAAQTGCTVAITFQPTTSGQRSGTLTLSDSAGTQAASLTGTGTNPATDTLSPLALTFAAQAFSTTSATQLVTLTNTGDVALTLLNAQISSGDFTATSGCGVSLVAHSSCNIAVAFAPRSLGAQTGALTLSDQYRAQTVTLSGTGTAPAGISLSPVNGLSFPATGIALTATAQAVTLTNNGGPALTFSSITASGDFAILASSTCGATLAPTATCTLLVVFSPTATGARSGTLTLVDNAASSPQTLPLTGSGIDFSLNPNGPTSASAPSGTPAVFPLLLSSPTGISGVVAFTCTGNPAHSTCNVNPTSATLGVTATISVTVDTGLTLAALHPPVSRNAPSGFWLALLIPVGLFALLRRRSLPQLVSLVLFLSIATAALSGCGSGGRYVPPPTAGSGTAVATPTPSGTYPITVTATSDGLTRSVALTLVVQ